MFIRLVILGLILLFNFSAPAYAVDCGGGAFPDCGPKEWCSYSPENTCGVLGRPGTCQPRPEVCTRIYLPVCGCDGKTYANACSAHASGMGVAYAGTCRAPSGKAIPPPKGVLPKLGAAAGKRGDRVCPQVITCGIKNGQPKEYPDPCAAQDDGATNIAPKTGPTCPGVR